MTEGSSSLSPQRSWTRWLSSSGREVGFPSQSWLRPATPSSTWRPTVAAPPDWWRPAAGGRTEPRTQQPAGIFTQRPSEDFSHWIVTLGNVNVNYFKRKSIWIQMFLFLSLGLWNWLQMKALHTHTQTEVSVDPMKSKLPWTFTRIWTSNIRLKQEFEVFQTKRLVMIEKKHWAFLMFLCCIASELKENYIRFSSSSAFCCLWGKGRGFQC